MSSLPVLIDAEPANDTAPDPALFTRERQAAFLAALAASGQVRSASAQAGVSHQTAYRTRLASPVPPNVDRWLRLTVGGRYGVEG